MRQCCLRRQKIQLVEIIISFSGTRINWYASRITWLDLVSRGLSEGLSDRESQLSVASRWNKVDTTSFPKPNVSCCLIKWQSRFLSLLSSSFFVSVYLSICSTSICFSLFHFSHFSLDRLRLLWRYERNRKSALCMTASMSRVHSSRILRHQRPASSRLFSSDIQLLHFNSFKKFQFFPISFENKNKIWYFKIEKILMK